MAGKKTRENYGDGSVHQHHTPECNALKPTRCKCKWRGTKEAGWTAAGKRRRITVTGKTEAEARRRLRDKSAEIERAAGQVATQSAARMTVKNWSDAWLEIRLETVRPATYTSDRNAVRQFIVPTIGVKRLVELGPADVRAVNAKVRAKGLGQPSVLRVQRILVKMLRDSLEEGYSVPSAIFNIKAGEKPESAREALEIEQAVAVIEQAAATLPHATRYLVSFIQGLRQGEALGLTWEALDFEARTITVDWQLQPLPYRDKADRSAGFRIPANYEVRHLAGRFHLVRPKSKAGRRVIPMMPEMADALLAYRETASENPHGLVWARPNGWPIDKAHDAQEFRDLQAAVGVHHPSGRPFVGHEMRNTAAQILKELGVDEVTITAIMGHSSYLVSRGYMTSRMDEKRKAIEGAARMLSRPGQPLALDASGDTTDARPQ